MKVLLVNITGKTGSTGKITSDIRSYLLDQGHDAVVAYSVDDIKEKGYYKLSKRWELAIALRLTRLGRSNYKGNPFALCRLKTIIEKEQPDIVHLHCINCNCINIYKTFEYLAKTNTRTVVTHHAEFFYTGSCPHSFDCMKFVNNQCDDCKDMLYSTSNVLFANPHKNWHRMYEAINRFDIRKLYFVAVSPWVRERSIMSPIVNKYPCKTILNGLDTNIFHYINDNSVLERRIKRTNMKIVLHISPFFNPIGNSMKGGNYVIEMAKQFPGVLFVVVASSSINTNNLPENVLFWGKATSQNELANLYSIADITLLTSKRETFSMVTAESLCCGTPVVGFLAGGPESIAIDKYCSFVEYGNTSMLYDSLRQYLSFEYDKKMISSEACKKYSKDVMGEEYLQLYKQLL